MVRVGVMTALAVALGVFSFRLPQGGRISLDLVPILVIAEWEGLELGVLCGVLYGFLDIQLEQVNMVHPLQMLLDYPLAFGSLGLAGIARGAGAPWLSAAVVAACLLRLLCHIVVGVIWYTHGYVALSFYYNITFMGPDTVMAAVLVPALVLALRGRDA